MYAIRSYYETDQRHDVHEAPVAARRADAVPHPARAAFRHEARAGLGAHLRPVLV